QAIGDVRAELEAIAASPRTEAPIQPVAVERPFWRRALWPSVSAIVVGVLAAAIAWVLKPERPGPIVRFSFDLPTAQIGARRLVAVSPDGTLIGYVADRRLYVRSIHDLQAIPLSGSEAADGVNLPAFSPDGRSLAFYSVSDNAIKRIDVTGGPPVT